MEYFTSCCQLFNDIFQASLGAEAFRFAAGFALFEVALALFRMFSRGTARG